MDKQAKGNQDNRTIERLQEENRQLRTTIDAIKSNFDVFLAKIERIPTKK